LETSFKISAQNEKLENDLKLQNAKIIQLELENTNSELENRKLKATNEELLAKIEKITEEMIFAKTDFEIITEKYENLVNKQWNITNYSSNISPKSEMKENDEELKFDLRNARKKLVRINSSPEIHSILLEKKINGLTSSDLRKKHILKL